MVAEAYPLDAARAVIDDTLVRESCADATEALAADVTFADALDFQTDYEIGSEAQKLEELGADTEFFGKFRNGSADGEQLIGAP